MRAASTPGLDAVIVGAGPAGLATAACLEQHQEVSLVLLEKGESVGTPWHEHYECLRLHTDKAHSGLPGFPIPDDYPTYPSRLQFIEYLEAYARHFELSPVFGQQVQHVYHQNGFWYARTGDNLYEARNLVVATGYNAEPNIPSWPGQEGFTAPLIHSSDYENAAPYRGKRVLIVGFGNSGGEIAKDLHDHGASPYLSIRNPVNVVPRDVFGVPLLDFAIPLTKAPAPMADAMAAPTLRAVMGNVEKCGLKRPSYGPFTGIERHDRIPLIDVGTMPLICKGHIPILPELKEFASHLVEFADGTRWEFDAVILATGYRPAAGGLFEDGSGVIDERGRPRRSGRESPVEGLYFCGFHVPATGMLREIGFEARRIAREISNRESPPVQSRRISQAE